jgi:cell division protease FtsH
MKNNKKNTKSKKIKYPGKGPNALLILIIFMVSGILYLFWYNNTNRETDTLSYTRILENIENSNVKAMTVQDLLVQGVYKNGKRFTGYIAPTQLFWELARKHSVETEVWPPDRQSWSFYLIFLALLPFLILLLFFYFKQSQGGSSGKIFSVGKSKARFFTPNSMSITFKDVAGVVEAKEDLKDIVEFIKSPERFEKIGASIPRGVLLNGAPGNGKTLLAKAVAGEALCPFFSINGSDFVEVFVGVGASRVRDLFNQARKHTPCIVFIDEIDAVGRQRGIGLGGGNDEREQTLNQLLAEMDGFSTEHSTVIILAATNRPDVLDKALLRPGRFDRIVEVPFPDLVSREKILNIHAKGVKLEKDVSLKKIAQGTPGFSGADLRNVINEAALIASKQHSEKVDVNHLESARDKILLGSERKTLIFTQEEKKMTAFHEAGHTLLNLLLLNTDPFHKVTIIPRGRALGVSWSLPEKDKYSQTKNEMLSRITVCFGGLIAENIVFDAQTSGVANDLEQATKIARAMVKRFGMSELGPVNYNTSEEHPYLGRDIQNHKEFSEKMYEKIDQAVEKIINSCFEHGKKLINENMEKLKKLGEALLEKETLSANEVYKLLDIAPRKTHEF